MKSFRAYNRISRVTTPFVVVLSFCAALPAFAVEELPAGAAAPTWVKKSRENESYLVSTQANRERTWNDELFDPKQARDMRAEYESRVDAEAAQDNAGLTTHYDEASRFDTMRNFAKRAMNSISHLQIQARTEHLKETIENSNFPKEPIAAAVLTASLYAGRSMRFRMMDGTPVDTRVGIKDKIAQVTVPLSPGVTGTVAYNPNNPAGVCAEDNACAMLSKELVPNVSAVVNSASKGRASVVYSLTF